MRSTVAAAAAGAAPRRAAVGAAQRRRITYQQAPLSNPQEYCNSGHNTGAHGEGAPEGYEHDFSTAVHANGGGRLKMSYNLQGSCVKLGVNEVRAFDRMQCGEETLEEKNQDVRPRHWDEMGTDQSGKRRFFRVAVQRMTQEELNAKIAAEDTHGQLPDLTDAQRERMRARRRRQERLEQLSETVQRAVKMGNRGRRNIGLLNDGDWNTGLCNRGEKNKGILCRGDYNKGFLLFGNDNKGIMCFGNGNVGMFIYGSHNRGVDIWGDKLQGILRTGDSHLKLRQKTYLCAMPLLYVLWEWYSMKLKVKKRKQWLNAMDPDNTQGMDTDAAVAALQERKHW